MKHPRYEILQDYFENALNSIHEGLVKEHLLNCDQCTNILSQFAQVERNVKTEKSLAISEVTKERIFRSAQVLLAQKSEAIKRREERQELLKNFVQDWKDVAFPEIKIPALQICSISLVITVFAIFMQMESREETYYRPIATDVNVFTYNDVPQDVEK